MNGDIEKNEFSKDLIAAQARNEQPVTITLTAIEVFAIVSIVQVAEEGNGIIPKMSPLGNFAKEVAKKKHNHLDPNSLLSLQLNKGWESGAESDG
jgi:hypothetical protein